MRAGRGSGDRDLLDARLHREVGARAGGGLRDGRETGDRHRDAAGDEREPAEHDATLIEGSVGRSSRDQAHQCTRRDHRGLEWDRPGDRPPGRRARRARVAHRARRRSVDRRCGRRRCVGDRAGRRLRRRRAGDGVDHGHRGQRAVRRARHLRRLLPSGVLRAARRRRLPRADGRRLLRHAARGAGRRAVDDRARPRPSGDHLVDRRPDRRVRLLRVRSGEVRGARAGGDAAAGAGAARDRGRVRLPARHAHAGIRRRERAQAGGDRAHLRRDQAPRGRARGPGDRAGIEKDRLVITADVQTAALARAAGLLGPYVRRTMDRQIRKVRREQS